MKNTKLVSAIALVLVFTMALSATALAANYSWRYSDNTLKRGHSNNYVKNLQADLTRNTTYTLTHDGIFGSNTEKAAIEFQGDNHLAKDGQVGLNTKTALYPHYDSRYNY